MASTCHRCGTAADAPEGGLPAGWSLGVGRRGAEPLCADCTRANVRAIEAKLPEEWWEA